MLGDLPHSLALHPKTTDVTAHAEDHLKILVLQLERAPRVQVEWPDVCMERTQYMIQISIHTSLIIFHAEGGVNRCRCESQW